MFEYSTSEFYNKGKKIMLSIMMLMLFFFNCCLMSELYSSPTDGDFTIEEFTVFTKACSNDLEIYPSEEGEYRCEILGFTDLNSESFKYVKTEDLYNQTTVSTWIYGNPVATGNVIYFLTGQSDKLDLSSSNYTYTENSSEYYDLFSILQYVPNWNNTNQYRYELINNGYKNHFNNTNADDSLYQYATNNKGSIYYGIYYDLENLRNTYIFESDNFAGFKDLEGEINDNSIKSSYDYRVTSIPSLYSTKYELYSYMVTHSTKDINGNEVSTSKNYTPYYVSSDAYGNSKLYYIYNETEKWFDVYTLDYSVASVWDDSTKEKDYVSQHKYPLSESTETNIKTNVRVYFNWDEYEEVRSVDKETTSLVEDLLSKPSDYNNGDSYVYFDNQQIDDYTIDYTWNWNYIIPVWKNGYAFTMGFYEDEAEALNAAKTSGTAPSSAVLSDYTTTQTDSKTEYQYETVDTYTSYAPKVSSTGLTSTTKPTGKLQKITGVSYEYKKILTVVETELGASQGTETINTTQQKKTCTYGVGVGTEFLTNVCYTSVSAINRYDYQVYAFKSNYTDPVYYMFTASTGNNVYYTTKKTVSSTETHGPDSNGKTITASQYSGLSSSYYYTQSTTVVDTYKEVRDVYGWTKTSSNLTTDWITTNYNYGSGSNAFYTSGNSSNQYVSRKSKNLYTNQLYTYTYNSSLSGSLVSSLPTTYSTTKPTTISGAGSQAYFMTYTTTTDYRRKYSYSYYVAQVVIKSKGLGTTSQTKYDTATTYYIPTALLPYNFSNFVLGSSCTSHSTSCYYIRETNDDYLADELKQITGVFSNSTLTTSATSTWTSQLRKRNVLLGSVSMNYTTKSFSSAVTYKGFYDQTFTTTSTNRTAANYTFSAYSSYLYTSYNTDPTTPVEAVSDALEYINYYYDDYGYNVAKTYTNTQETRTRYTYRVYARTSTSPTTTSTENSPSYSTSGSAAWNGDTWEIKNSYQSGTKYKYTYNVYTWKLTNSNTTFTGAETFQVLDGTTVGSTTSKPSAISGSPTLNTSDSNLTTARGNPTSYTAKYSYKWIADTSNANVTLYNYTAYSKVRDTTRETNEKNSALNTSGNYTDLVKINNLDVYTQDQTYTENWCTINGTKYWCKRTGNQYKTYTLYKNKIKNGQVDKPNQTTYTTGYQYKSGTTYYDMSSTARGSIDSAISTANSSKVLPSDSTASSNTSTYTGYRYVWTGNVKYRYNTYTIEQKTVKLYRYDNTWRTSWVSPGTANFKGYSESGYTINNGSTSYKKDDTITPTKTSVDYSSKKCSSTTPSSSLYYDSALCYLHNSTAQSKSVNSRVIKKYDFNYANSAVLDHVEVSSSSPVNTTGKLTSQSSNSSTLSYTNYIPNISGQTRRICSASNANDYNCYKMTNEKRTVTTYYEYTKHVITYKTTKTKTSTINGLNNGYYDSGYIYKGTEKITKTEANGQPTTKNVLDENSFYKKINLYNTLKYYNKSNVKQLVLENTDTSSSTTDYVSYSLTGLTANTKYTLSINGYKSASGLSGKIEVIGASTVSNTLGTSASTKTVTFTTTSSGTAEIRIYVSTSTTKGYIYINWMQVEIGTSATTYTSYKTYTKQSTRTNTYYEYFKFNTVHNYYKASDDKEQYPHGNFPYEITTFIVSYSTKDGQKFTNKTTNDNSFEHTFTQNYISGNVVASSIMVGYDFNKNNTWESNEYWYYKDSTNEVAAKIENGIVTFKYNKTNTKYQYYYQERRRVLLDITDLSSYFTTNDYTSKTSNEGDIVIPLNDTTRMNSVISQMSTTGSSSNYVLKDGKQYPIDSTYGKYQLLLDYIAYKGQSKENYVYNATTQTFHFNKGNQDKYYQFSILIDTNKDLSGKKLESGYSLVISDKESLENIFKNSNYFSTTNDGVKNGYTAPLGKEEITETITTGVDSTEKIAIADMLKYVDQTDETYGVLLRSNVSNYSNKLFTTLNGTSYKLTSENYKFISYIEIKGNGYWEEKTASSSNLSQHIEYNSYLHKNYKLYVFNVGDTYVTTWAKDVASAVDSLPEYNITSNSVFASLTVQEVHDYITKATSNKIEITNAAGITIYIPLDNFFNLTGISEYIYELSKVGTDFKFVNYINLNSLDDFYMDDNAMGSTWLMYPSQNSSSPFTDVLEKSLQHSLTKINKEGIVGFKVKFNGMNNYWKTSNKYTVNGGEFEIYGGEGSSQYNYYTHKIHDSYIDTNLVTAIPQLTGAIEKNATVSSRLFTSKYENGSLVEKSGKTVEIPEFIMLNTGKKTVDFKSDNDIYNLIQTAKVNSYDTYTLYAVSYDGNYIYYRDYIEGLLKVFNAIYERTGKKNYFFQDVTVVQTKESFTCSAWTYSYCLSDEEFEMYAPVIYNENYRLSLATSVMLNLDFDGSTFKNYDATAISHIINDAMGSISDINDRQTYYSVLYFLSLAHNENSGLGGPIWQYRQNDEYYGHPGGPFSNVNFKFYPGGILADSYASNYEMIYDFCVSNGDYNFVSTCMDDYIINGQFPISLDYREMFNEDSINVYVLEDMIKGYMSVRNMLEAVKNSTNKTSDLVYVKTEIDNLNLVYQKLSNTDMIRDQFVNTIVVDSPVNNGTFMNTLMITANAFERDFNDFTTGNMKLSDIQYGGTNSLVATLGDYVPQNYYLNLNNNSMKEIEIEFSVENFNTGSATETTMLTNDILGTTGIMNVGFVQEHNQLGIDIDASILDMHNFTNNGTQYIFDYSYLKCYLVSNTDEQCDSTNSGGEFWNMHKVSYYMGDGMENMHGALYRSTNTNYYFYTFYGLNFDIEGMRTKEKETNNNKKSSVIPIPLVYDFIYENDDNKGGWFSSGVETAVVMGYAYNQMGQEDLAYEKQGPRSLKYTNYHYRGKYLPHVLDYMYNNFGTYSNTNSRTIDANARALEGVGNSDITIQGGEGSSSTTTSNTSKFTLNADYKEFYMNQMFNDENFARLYYYDWENAANLTDPHSKYNASYQVLEKYFSNPLFGYTLHYSLDDAYDVSKNNFSNLLTNENVYIMKLFKDSGTRYNEYSNFNDYWDAMYLEYNEGAPYSTDANMYNIYGYSTATVTNPSGFSAISKNKDFFLLSMWDTSYLSKSTTPQTLVGTKLLSGFDYVKPQHFEHDLHVWIDFGEGTTTSEDVFLDSSIEFDGNVNLNDTNPLRNANNFVFNLVLPGKNTSGFASSLSDDVRSLFQNYELQLFYKPNGNTQSCVEGYAYYNGNCYLLSVGDSYGYNFHLNNTMSTYKVYYKYKVFETQTDQRKYNNCLISNQINQESRDCYAESLITVQVEKSTYVLVSTPNNLTDSEIEREAYKKLDTSREYTFNGVTKISTNNNINYGYWIPIEVDENQTLTVPIENLLPNTQYYVLARARYQNSLVSEATYLTYDRQSGHLRTVKMSDESLSNILSDPTFITGDDMVQNPYGTISNPISSCAGSVCNGDELLKNELIPVWLMDTLFSVPKLYSTYINDTTSQEFLTIQEQGWTAGFETVQDSGIFKTVYDSLSSTEQSKYTYDSTTGRYHAKYNVSFKYMLHLTSPEVVAVRIGLNEFDNEYRLINNYNNLSGKLSFIEGTKISTIDYWNSTESIDSYLVYTLNETNKDFSSKLLYEDENVYFDERLLNYKVYNIVVTGNSLSSSTKIYNVLYQNKFDNTYAYLDYNLNNKMDTNILSNKYYNYYGEETHEETLFSKFKDAYWETTWREEKENDGTLSYRKFITVDGYSYLAHIRDGKVDSIIVPSKNN